MVDRVGDFLDSLPGRRVTTGESPQQIRQALDAGRTLPKEGSDPAKLMGHAADLDRELEAFTNSLRITTFRYHPSGLGSGDEQVERYLNS